ncbi:MAG: hypothetical protein JNM66_13320 [Bryobacterales bacterium]|nr:hypothetical protein [Bryobacterales bacterium]
MSKQMKLADLTPGARAAVEQKAITGGWDGRSLVKLLGELERWDNMAEERKARAKRVFLAGVIGSVAGFFLMFVVSAVMEEFLWGLPLFLAPLGVLFAGIKMKKAARAIDLPNELRVSLRPVLRQLSQDLHPEEKIKVTLNLAGIDENKCAGKKDLPIWGRNRRVTQSTYEEELCSLRMPLTDGGEAVLRMENTFVKVERSYTSTRGKSKSKTKWKKLSTVTAMLVPAVRINWEAGRGGPAAKRDFEKLSFVEKNGVMAARLDRYYKFKAADEAPGAAVPGTEIVAMFVRLAAMRPQAAGGAR